MLVLFAWSSPACSPSPPPVIIDRFAQPGPLSSSPQCLLPSHYCGGTFLGLLQHLPYIRSLGFNALLLSPVVENSPYGYHGYWPRSFTKINGRFGSEEDLRAVVDRAHSLGMLVMVDGKTDGRRMEAW